MEGTRSPAATRPYAKRLPPHLRRRVMLSARVSDRSRNAVLALARRSHMSPSEYVARLINAHLNALLSQRGPSVLSGVRPC